MGDLVLAQMTDSRMLARVYGRLRRNHGTDIFNWFYSRFSISPEVPCIQKLDNWLEFPGLSITGN